MSYTQRFIEVNQPGGELYPLLRIPATYRGGWLSMSNHQRAIFIVQVGAMVATSTLNFQVQQGDAAAPTVVKAIAGKAITELTAAGGDGNDLVAVEVRTEELDVSGGFEYIRGVVTVGVANVTCGVLALRLIPNYPPVVTTGWTEIVD